ncbi:MAG TPA: BatA and WFA domain-containing protein, partial [Planctomycetaceae bacterium]|nr:BatA and WFA domain-containing protein [Planctomycetaceae bacterium]
MNWPGVNAPASAWLFAMLIPLVIFYFLKLKRPRVEIPSLALWRQVMNDQRVNSPFQRFKRNILLLLQILLLLCVAAAAMQPFIPSGAERAQYIPVLIDCSASMGALDKPGGQTRLEEAKARVGEMIDNLLSDQRMSLVAVDASARRLSEFTNNKR